MAYEGRPVPSDEVSRLAFGRYVLDTARRTLTTADGSPVSLSGQAFDALVVLVRQAGQVVDRARLMDTLWPDAIVEDNNLNRVILLLRRALGDGYIVTVKGRGYQFVEDVRVVNRTDDDAPDDAVRDVDDGSATRAHRWPGGRGAFVAVAAVLLIATAFVLMRGQASSSAWPAQFGPVPTNNARALQLFMSAQRFSMMQVDRDPDLVIRQLRRAVEEDPGFALAWAHLSIEHNEMFWFRRDVSEARQQLSYDAAMRAIELDPDLAEAHVALGWHHYHIDQDVDRAMAALERAAVLAPENPDIYWRMGNVLRRYGDVERAFEAFERVVEIDPTAVVDRHAPASLLVLQRDYEAADAMLDEILRVIPDHIPSLTYKILIPQYRDGEVTALAEAAGDARFERPNSWALPQPVLAWTAAIYERDFERALDALEGWTDTSSVIDTYVSRDGLYGLTHELAGRQAEAGRYWRSALAQVDGVLDQNPAFPEAQMARAEALVRLGQANAAVEQASAIIADYEAAGDLLSAAKHRIDAVRRVFVPAGEIDRAFDELDTYLAGYGDWSIEGLAPDPAFDPIRDDPRFAGLLARYRRR